MKDIKLNPLDQSQRKILQIGVGLILLLFLGLYFFFKADQPLTPINNEVYLEGTKLQVFNDSYKFNGYPDKILMHYPYFMVVEASKPLTTIYNLETKQKEKEINDIILDYYQGNLLLNKEETFYNDINLKKYCDSAFIKNDTEILCISKETTNSINNMLININPQQPNLWKQDYASENILTTVSIIDGKTYIGEINYESKQNFLSIDGEKIAIENPVSIVYPVSDNIYFASFSSALNNGKQYYYLIQGNNPIKQNEDKIKFLEKSEN